MSENENTNSYYETPDEDMQWTKAMSGFRSFRNIDTDISSNPGLDYDTYECFRPNEKIPKTHREITQKCREIYEKNGIIRNIVDLMTDFTYRGIKITHPQKSRQKFYQDWWKKADMLNIVERFCNTEYVAANIFMRRHMGNVTIKRGSESIRRNIPVKYNFVNPAIVDIKDKELGAITGLFKYIIKFEQDIAKRISNSIFKVLNDEIEINEKGRFIKFFYKKNDWDPFAKPFIYSLIKDVSMLDKLDLADRTMLDSAAKPLRIIKLGSLEYRLAPTEAAFRKLQGMLEANTGSGMTTVMWGPDIELLETKTDFYKFLNYDKYEPPIRRIYQSSGIPTLSGDISSGASNTSLSLDILIQRLEYGRKLLNSFLKTELDMIRDAIGDTVSAEIEYKHMNFSDESAHRAMLIQMADRNLISDELIQEYFGHNPVMEKSRIKREDKERDRGSRPRRVGPYTDMDFEKSMLKVAMTTNLVDPEELGEVYKNMGRFEYMEPEQPAPVQNSTDPKIKGQPQQGRPKNSKDTSKRKTRVSKAAETQIWAVRVYDKITDFIKPYVLEAYNKKGLRQLTAQEFKEYDELKAGILFNMNVGMDSKDDIEKAARIPVNSDKLTIYKNMVSAITKDLDRELNTNERVQVQAIIYASQN